MSNSDSVQLIVGVHLFRFRLLPREEVEITGCQLDIPSVGPLLTAGCSQLQYYIACSKILVVVCN